MAEEFFEPDIPVDSEELADTQFAHMEEGFPGWVPAAGNLDTWVLESGSRMGSEVGTLALTPTPEIFRVYGAKVVGLLPINDTLATATSTWTLTDDDGHDIDEGTVVAIDDVAFEVASTVNVPAGQTVAAGVDLIAVDGGSAGSGLIGPVELVDNTEYDAAIVLDAPTQGGQDGESTEDYQNRLAREYELAAPRPLKPRDVELFARRVVGVNRVCVLNRYKPGPPYDADPEDNDAILTFSLSALDEVGQYITAGVRAVLQQTLQDARGTDWRIYIIAPDYSLIDVSFEAVAREGFAPADAQAAGIQAVSDFLSPINWGQPGFGEERRWVNTPEVRHRELAAALDRVESIDYIPVLQFGIQGTPLTENIDVLMPGKVPLPMPGDIAGEVVAP